MRKITRDEVVGIIEGFWAGVLIMEITICILHLLQVI